MIIKQKDPLNARKLELNILRSFDLPEDKAFLVEREWQALQNGERGEKDAAYYIDFDFANNPNCAVIHDLRLEHGGRVVQIDHLLINRLLDIHVLETKAYGAQLRIKEDGAFVACYGRKRIPVPSPLEQNRRHIEVLQSVIRDRDLAPRRLGIPMTPHFISCVLLHPKTELLRPKKTDTSRIMHADRFAAFYHQQYDDMGNAEFLGKTTRMISTRTLIQFAHRLAQLHQPGEVNYRERFGITDDDLKRKPDATKAAPKQEDRATPRNTSGYFCARCKKGITPTVARFCFDRKQRFGGRAYCMQCQKAF